MRTNENEMSTMSLVMENALRARREKEKERVISEINELRAQLPSICKDKIKRHLIEEITSTLNNTAPTIYDTQAPMVARVASLRFVFEMLINVRLLCQENDFTEKLYYSVAQQQLSKVERQLQKLYHDMAILELYIEKEKELHEQIKPGITKEEAKKILSQENTLYEQLDKELSLHLAQASWSGAKLQLELLRDKVVPLYQGRIDQFTKRINTIAKRLARDAEFSKKFDVRGQPTRVFKVLKDPRSWSKKAEDSGVSEEYEFIYDYTSSFLHCTSYSIFTPNEVNDVEDVLLSNFGNKYLNHIVEGLKAFVGL